MSTKQTISLAREHLAEGNPGAYARILSAAIRSAMSDRAVSTYLTAINADCMADHFRGLNTDCPTAR